MAQLQAPTANRYPTRRAVLTGGAAAAASLVLPPGSRAQSYDSAMRQIPSSGEAITAVGLGTWITFNVGNDPVLRTSSAAVMDAFFKAGGHVIDSSPMYGSAQNVVGEGLEALGYPKALFSADKVWTPSPENGPVQIEQSRRYWRLPQFDLLQVHNLVAWEDHLPLLNEMKSAGNLRYVGITTSHGRRHEVLEQIMRTQPLDFVQVTYNPFDRDVEARILPLALDRGIGVIVNRPFRGGQITERLANVPLPDWSGEIGATSWAQIALKFILSHPAVTVTIPATTRAEHAVENVAAASGPLPDPAIRKRIAAHIRNL